MKLKLEIEVQFSFVSGNNKRSFEMFGVFVRSNPSQEKSWLFLLNFFFLVKTTKKCEILVTILNRDVPRII